MICLLWLLRRFNKGLALTSLCLVLGLISHRLTAQTISTIAGTGESGFSGDGGPATQAQLSYPTNLAMDAQGNLFVLDGSNYRVRKIDRNGIITTVAGSDYNWDTNPGNGDGGPATQAGLLDPRGIALDTHGNLYIADNNTVRKVDTNGIITTVAGNGEWGHPSDEVGDGQPATSVSLSFPWSVAVDAQDNLLIADSGHNRIRKVDSNGIITTIAGNGTEGYGGDGGPATSATLTQLGRIESDLQGNLYLTADNRIRKIDRNGIITTVVGSGAVGFGGDGGPATQAHLWGPAGMAVDAQGNFYFSDSGNQRIRKVDTNGIITTVVGTGTSGYNGDGGEPTSARVSNPGDVLVDAQGNLLIADANNRIRKVTWNGIPMALNSLTLIDADLDRPIQDLVVYPNIRPDIELNLAGFVTRQLNIRANTSPSNIGSVVFQLSGQQTRTHIENAAPYALFGDDNGNYRGWTPPVGSYTLIATPYSGPNGTGTAGTPISVSLTVVDHLKVEAFSRIYPLTDDRGATILDGDVLEIHSPNDLYNIRANTSPVTVGSVIMQLSGQLTRTQIENQPPYALFRDDNGDYRTWKPEPGQYTLTATPYSGPNGTGTAGIPLTIHFEFIPDRFPRSRMSADNGLEPGEPRVFPNPFRASFTIQMPAQQPSRQAVGLYDMLGRPVWQQSAVDTSQPVQVGDQLSEGVYFLQVGDDPKAKRLKLIKAP